jgi:hypothetical protein
MTQYSDSVRILISMGARVKRIGKKHELWELDGKIIPLSRGAKANSQWVAKLKMMERRAKENRM